MQYEIRVWKNQKNMPTGITAASAKNKLEAIAENVDALLGNSANRGNPDILIDTNALGEDAILSAGVTFSMGTVKIDGNETKVRTVKMKITGNLYLPLEGDLLGAAVKKITGATNEDENKKRNTLHLSKWAAAKPDDKNVTAEPYYRAVILSITTKAGDFRLISATNMYVESYNESYDKGEFGTFELNLAQTTNLDEVQAGVSNDNDKNVNTILNVDGLSTEKESLISKIGKGIAEAAAVVGTVAAVGGTVLKTTTETVEKFTGETDVTRKIKGAADATTAAGKTSTGIGTLSKDGVKNLDKNIENIAASGNEVVQKSVDAHYSDIIPLSEMEKLYLDKIKANPEKYQAYLNATADEKRKMLEDAAQAKLDRAAITKYYEESQIDMEQVKKTEEDIAKMKAGSDDSTAPSNDTDKTAENLVKKPEEDIANMKTGGDGSTAPSNDTDKTAENLVKKPEEDIANMKTGEGGSTAPSNDTVKTAENPVKKPAVNNNVSLSGANLNDMLSSAANKKNGNSQ